MGALEKAQELQYMGLVALQLVVSFWTRGQIHVPCLTGEFFGYVLLILLDIYLGVVLLDPTVTLCLIF